MVPTLPNEIVDRILDHLHASQRTLRLCMQVSRDWLPTCRFHLYKQEHFTKAAAKGIEWVVQLLLQRKDIDVNAESNSHHGSALVRAAEGGHINIVKLLLAVEEIDVNARSQFDRSPLLSGVWGGHREIVKLLLERDDTQMMIRTIEYHLHHAF